MYASRTSKRSKRAVRESAHVTLETLEARQLLSAYHHHYHSGSHSTPSVGGYRRYYASAPLAVKPNVGGLGLEGATGDDQILITQAGGPYTNHKQRQTSTGTRAVSPHCESGARAG